MPNADYQDVKLSSFVPILEVKRVLDIGVVQHTCWFCEQMLTQLLNRHGFSNVNVKCEFIFRETNINKILLLMNMIVPLPSVLNHNALRVMARSA